jgi:hypothetical protein
MVVRARVGQAELICTDCGHRADPLLYRDRMRRALLGVVALLAIALVGGLIFTLALLQDSNRVNPSGADSGGQERAE